MAIAKKAHKAKSVKSSAIKKAEIKSAPKPAFPAYKPVGPEPPNKLVLEYIISGSPTLLFEFLSSPSGLSEWFADNVNVTGPTYTFFWDGSQQQAVVLDMQQDKSLRLRWTDRPKNSYFEFTILKNELTQDLTLLITDFAESAAEKNSLELLWHEQIQRLMKVLGSKV